VIARRRLRLLCAGGSFNCDPRRPGSQRNPDQNQYHESVTLKARSPGIRILDATVNVSIASLEARQEGRYAATVCTEVSGWFACRRPSDATRCHRSHGDLTRLGVSQRQWPDRAFGFGRRPACTNRLRSCSRAVYASGFCWCRSCRDLRAIVVVARAGNQTVRFHSVIHPRRGRSYRLGVDRSGGLVRRRAPVRLPRDRDSSKADRSRSQSVVAPGWRFVWIVSGCFR
jgi:hypothetical protein